MRQPLRNQSSWYLRMQDADAVFIIDNNDGSLSVTNDAENVVRACYTLYGDKRIIYRDTENEWDELVHNKGQFVSFARYNGRVPR